MHRGFVRAITAAVVSVVIAGCSGGSHSSSLPSAPGRGLSPQLNGGSANSGVLPTLYVSGQGSVYAYNLPVPGASPSPDPNQAPVDSANGYYYQSPGGGLSASIAGIATNSNGDLAIVQNVASSGNGNTCQVVLIPARSGSTTPNPNSNPCSTSGLAMGVTFTGAATATPSPNGFTDNINVLMNYQPQGLGNPYVAACDGNTSNSEYEVDEYQVNTSSVTYQNCTTLDNAFNVAYNGIAGSTNGAFFVDYGGTNVVSLASPAARRQPGNMISKMGMICGSSGNTIERYDGSNSGVPTACGSVPGNPTALAVAVNTASGVGYRVVASVTSGVTTVYTFKVTGTTMTFTHALGSFNNPVPALAVDNNGNVYVGVNQPGVGTKIKVYGPNKTQATDPDYILNNPVRRGNPVGAVITGIAIAQYP